MESHLLPRIPIRIFPPSRCLHEAECPRPRPHPHPHPHPGLQSACRGSSVPWVWGGFFLPGPNPPSLGQLLLPTEINQNAFGGRFLPMSEVPFPTPPLPAITCQSTQRSENSAQLLPSGGLSCLNHSKPPPHLSQGWCCFSVSFHAISLILLGSRELHLSIWNIQSAASA